MKWIDIEYGRRWMIITVKNRTIFGSRKNMCWINFRYSNAGHRIFMPAEEFRIFDYELEHNWSIVKTDG